MQLDDMQWVLGRDGPFAETSTHFSPRPVQQDMAVAVQTAIHDQQSAIIEAGTGTGKTFAYLAPALLSGKKVIISTGTKTLQDQLYFNDIPRVQRALGTRAKVSLLKGRSNYLCLYRLDQARHDGRLDKHTQQQLSVIRAWAGQTRFGDKAELADIQENDAIWSRVTSTPENCLGADCSFYDDCYVYKARKQAQEADIVVVNHHLLLADLVLKQGGFGDLLPETDVFIIDEAHQLPELAGTFLSTQTSFRQIIGLAEDIRQEAKSLSASLDQVQMPLDKMQTAAKDLLKAMQVLPTRGTLQQLFADRSITQAWQHMHEDLKACAGIIASQAERSKGMERCHERLQAIVKHLDGAFASEHEDDDVRWYECHQHGFVIHMTPLDMAPAFTALRELTGATWIYTSATLSVAGTFEHFSRRLGLQDVATHLFKSPFDYATQAICYLPKGLPQPNQQGYTEAVVEAVKPVLEASGGRAFLLFTSHRALKLAAEKLHYEGTWPLFVQGEAPKHQLLENFRQSGNGLLLGAASFWEGVDVAGEALSVVMIDKLPFASPDNPVMQARMDAMRQAGNNPFMDYQVPTAAIALKQGAGRLIRDTQDRGVLMLCDPRITGKGYGRLFLRSLPKLQRSHDIAAIQSFFTATV